MGERWPQTSPSLSFLLLQIPVVYLTHGLGSGSVPSAMRTCDDWGCAELLADREEVFET